MSDEDKVCRGRSRLDEAMDHLDHGPRQVMKLWLEGMSQTDIAKTLGLTERAVSVIRAASVLEMRERIARLSPPEAT